MKTIEIGNLILVEVPKDAKDFVLIESHNYFKSPRIEHSIGGFDLDIKFDYEIIGLIEMPDLKFDFDVDDRMASCSSSCSQSDYYKGGKCDRNGCYGKDRNGMFTNKIQKAIQDAGIELTGNLLLIKKLK